MPAEDAPRRRTPATKSPGPARARSLPPRPENLGSHPDESARSKAEERAVERLRRICLALPPGMQQALVDDDPALFFVPPSVGRKGWIGVRIDRRPDWNAVASVVRDAHRFVASSRK